MRPIEALRKTPHVLNISEKFITYIDAFKRGFIEEYLKRQNTPRVIFQEAGLDTQVLGERRQAVLDDDMDYDNNYRCQWGLKKLTPVQYRNQLLLA